jgi:putative redox protein
MTTPVTKSAHLTLETVAGTGQRFGVLTGSGMRLTLDDREGRQGPTPVEALLAALGGCTAMDVVSILRKKRQDVRHYEVVVTGEQREEHPRRFGRIEVLHRVRGAGLNPAAIEDAIRLSVTRYCSVHASLAPDIEIVSRFEIVPA